MTATTVCRKHDPLPHGDLLAQISGEVICGNCGRKGMLSNGRRRAGRPTRIIWFRDIQKETPG